MLTPRHFADFREGLVASYEEEISGEAYFSALAKHYEGRAQEALRLLSHMEAMTAATIFPVVARHGLKIADVPILQSEGRREAEGRRGTGWNELVTQMAEEFPAHVSEFEEILAMAPVADARELGILVDHEAAAVEFARLERAGNAKSHAPPHAFIARYSI